MGQDSVAAVYAEVIKDVSKHLEQSFHEDGIDHVLANMTQLWVTRLLNARVLSPETDTRELHQLAQSVLTPAQATFNSLVASSSAQAGPGHSYHMPQYPQGYQQNFSARPLANPSAPRTIAQPQLPIPHYPQPPFDYSLQQPETYLNQTYTQQNRPTSAASLPAIANLGQHRPENPSAVGRPRPNLTRPPTTYPGPYPPPGPYNLPQNDGVDDDGLPSTEKVDEIFHQQIAEAEEAVIEFEVPEKLRKGRASKRIPQVDGEGDDDDEDPEEGGESEQENEGGNEESLNSSLDSDSDDQQQDIRDMVVCLFEKVTRARTKWRCVLKDGIMNLNGKDYLFHKNTGEFEW